jgi:FAD/FMN-containing dehydrogenase
VIAVPKTDVTPKAADGPALSRRAFLRHGTLAVIGASALAGCGSTPARSRSSSSRSTASSATTSTTSSAQAGGPPTAADWLALEDALSGRVVLPSSRSYGDAKLVYDLRFHDAAPAAIAYCASTTDVQRTIDFARRHAITPIPRCGGHSYAGYSTGSGLVIDVTPMNRVAVSASTARVEAGTRLIDLYSAVSAAGVLVPGGSCPTVGIAGLALGGGVGVLGRKYGLTADTIEEVTVVTADARVLRAGPSSEPDLYWACRGGGGGNFGVVTSFHLATQPIPPLALFTLEFPWAAAGDLLGAWARWMTNAPEELWSNCLLLSAGASGMIARSTGVFVGETSSLASLVNGLAGAVGATPTTNFVGAETYLRAMFVEAGCAEITLAQCRLSGPGSAGTLGRSAFAAKSAYLAKAPPPAGIAAITAAVENLHNELPELGGGLAFDAMGGAINAVAPDATAFVHRDALCGVQISGSWGSGTDTSTAAAVQDWLVQTASAIAPYTNGEAYQNYIDPTLADWQSAYYGANLPRLESIRRRYDPDAVFNFAQAIPLS